MLSKFLNLRFLLFDCFVYRQNVTCLKCFTRYKHYTGKVEDSQLYLKSLSQKLECYAQKYVFSGHTVYHCKAVLSLKIIMDFDDAIKFVHFKNTWLS